MILLSCELVSNLCHHPNLAFIQRLCYNSQNCKLDVSFVSVCPVIDDEFRHNIVKVAVDPRGHSRVGVDPQTTLTMLC